MVGSPVDPDPQPTEVPVLSKIQALHCLFVDCDALDPSVTGIGYALTRHTVLLDRGDGTGKHPAYRFDGTEECLRRFIEDVAAGEDWV